MIKFYIKETFKSLSKAKLSFFFSFITTAIAIILILTSLSLIIFSNLLEQSITDRVSVNLFLEENLAEQELSGLVKKLEGMESIKKIRYISKEEAEKNFVNETGEDFRKILEYNPLPASIQININPVYFGRIKEITRRLENIEGIEEVYYEADFIQSVLKILADIKYYLMIASVFLVIISFYLVYSTNRIILQTKIKQIETMKLVGARLNTIRIPIILNGLCIGILSSFVVIIVSAYIMSLVKNYYPIKLFSLTDNWLLLIFILFSGIVIGTLGSYLAVRKVSLRVNKIMF